MIYKNRESQCVICWKNIDKKKERYVEITDWNKGKFEDHCFHHLDCWQNKFKISQDKIQEQANEWIDKIKGLDLSKLNMGDQNDKGYSKVKFI